MLKKSLYTAALVCCVSIWLSCTKSDNDAKAEETIINPVAIEKTNAMSLYMHYMPWFETKSSSQNQQWGYHWTMNSKNPDIITDNKREIASYYYPLIGPYHSGDENVIKYHLLLMKYAGIDGILIDWYSAYDVNDYKMITDNTEAIIEQLDAIGLDFAIVYEDRFLQNIVDAGKAPTIVSAAKHDISYIQNHYFTNNNYIKLGNKPLLLNFGPISLQTEEQWTDVFSNISPTPTFLTLWYESSEAGINAQGEYSWVYEDNTHLSSFYQNRINSLQTAMGSAYPGFKDFYEEGGASSSIGWQIPHNNGATLNQTIQLAQNAQVDYLQFVTWNDYGEGTMIEPTVEFEYTYLQKIQVFAGATNAQPTDFDIIYQWYQLQATNTGNSTVQEKLNKAFKYLAAMQPEEALNIINAINN